MRHLLFLTLVTSACGAAGAGQSRYAATASFTAQAPEELKLDAEIVDCDDDVLLALGPDCELRGKWNTVDALIRVGDGSFRAGSFTVAADQTCTLGSHALKISSGVVKVSATRVANVSLGATESGHAASLTFTTGASGPVQACPDEPRHRNRRSPL